MSLSKREIALIGFLLLAGVVYGFYTYLYTPVENRIDVLKTDNEQFQIKLEENEKARKSNIKPADNLKKLQNEYKVLLTKVPEDPYVPEMMVYLADSARESSVELKSLNYKYDDKTGSASSSPGSNTNTARTGSPANYRASHIEVEVEGSYYNLLTFMLKVENAPRLYVLTGAKFEAGKRKAPVEAGFGAEPVPSPEDGTSMSTKSGSAANPAAGSTAAVPAGSPVMDAAQAPSGSSAYDGNDITLKMKFDSYFDQTTTGGMKGVEREVPPAAAGKNPFS